MSDGSGATSMPRPPRNPFYVVLGIVGFAFTITAVASCVSVLRGIRPDSIDERGAHPMERLMELHGTTMLTTELVILAIATVGAIWVDHHAGERIRRARAAEQARHHADDAEKPDEP